MIKLTRLNGCLLVLNSDLIKSAQASPDTMITLLTGEKLIVRESCTEVVARMVSFRARLLAEVAKLLPPPRADSLQMVTAASLSSALTSEATNSSAISPEIAQRRRRREEDEE